MGAGGGVGTGLSCLGAFEMGAAYVVTGSVNQACVKYPSFDAIPAPDRDRIEKKVLKDTFANIRSGTKEYFAKVDPSKIPLAEKNPKMKMALVFRWYLGSSSRWAVQGAVSPWVPLICGSGAHLWKRQRTVMWAKLPACF